MMECRKLKLTLVSAENLPEDSSSDTMSVYAEVSLNGEPKTNAKTDVDNRGESNPRWNFAAEFTMTESAVHKKGVNLIVLLYRKKRLGDRFIGQVKISVQSLFDLGPKSEDILSYRVEGTLNGSLSVSYNFGDKILVPKPSTEFRSKIFVIGLVALGLPIDALIDEGPFIFVD